MADTTTIEWVLALARATGRDARVWNPLRGCLPASPGCTNCWAAPVAAMRAKNPNPKISARHADLTTPNGTAFNGTCRATDEWNLPVQISRPSVFFVCSESDLFFAGHDDEAVDKVFDVIATAPWHHFLILTKRAERLPQFFARPAFGREVAVFDWPLPNVWLGVSVEDQQRADERIPHLLATPAAKRFLSCEPLLGSVNISAWLFGREEPCADCPKDVDCECGWMGRQTLEGEAALHWVIVGGESGPGARPMHPDWARGLQDECKAAEVPFFFKQWGDWCPIGALPFDSGELYHPAPLRDPEAIRRCKVDTGILLSDGRLVHPAHPDAFQQGFASHQTFRTGKKAAGRLLDGREYLQIPEVHDGR